MFMIKQIHGLLNLKTFLVFFFLCGLLSNLIAQEKRLKVCLDRDGFSDRFDLIFKPEGDAAINDRDALKIGEGYVVLAGMYTDGRHTAIEERPVPANDLEVKLFVKGYSGGQYRLKIDGMDVVLKDKFLHINQTITAGNKEYSFKIDPEIKSSYGGDRFSLLFNFGIDINGAEAKNDQLVAYPNPCSESLYLNIKPFKMNSCEVQIRNLSGNVIWKRSFADVSGKDVLELDVHSLDKGIYLLGIKSLEAKPLLKMIKIIKE